MAEGSIPVRARAVWAEPLVQQLVDGRLHLQHGPIDVVLKAWGSPHACDKAYRAVADRFSSILFELTGERAALKRPLSEHPRVTSPVARRMTKACAPFEGVFITPMAAVAGAVADELIGVMTGAAQLDRAFVNDGGDIALHLNPGQSIAVGLMADFRSSDIPARMGEVTIRASDPVRGIATSGARGRSFSLGICDSVTVLAASAAQADAAATLIANAVDLDRSDIVRRPAIDLDPDSDLGTRLVTVAVPKLPEADIDSALSQGLDVARRFHASGLIADAALTLQGRTVTLGHVLDYQGKSETCL